jgi:RNA polymerase sigma factor (TIGR02999 family)
MSDVTHILSAIERGDSHAAEKLLPLVYEELRKLAAARLKRERCDHSLQATSLVHEAYLRLVDSPDQQRWQTRGHFFAAAAEAMRRILVENARRKRALKSGGAMTRVDLDQAALAVDSEPDDLLDLEQSLSRLESEDPAAAKLAKLRLFAGLTIDEAAELLGVSRSSGFRHWTYARAFLQAEMQAYRMSGQ